MDIDSFHKTLMKALIVIWISGIAIVITDVFILDKEKRAWEELKPISQFSFEESEEQDKFANLRAQHERYMTEGILPSLSNYTPQPFDVETESKEKRVLDENNTSTSTIEDILLSAKEAELAEQIEPAAGHLHDAFMSADLKNSPLSDERDRNLTRIIYDLEQLEVESDVFETNPDTIVGDSTQLKDEVKKEGHQYAEPHVKGKVVIIIDDMGLTLRSKQVEIMEGPLTLAYLPYADGLKERTKRAKSNGHELMVHIPMEAMNSKLDGGPKVLTTNLSAEQFKETLEWGLSQFDGYVGVNNHMGSRLTKDKRSMEKLMNIIKDKDVFFIDSKTIGSSVAAKTAQEYGIAYAERDIFLDHEISKDFVRNALKKLEKVVAQKGYGIAIGHPHKETIEVLKEWMPTLKEKGLELVPASAVVKRPVSEKNFIATQTY